MKQKVTKDNWEALIHWNFALVGGFLGAYAILLHMGNFGSAQTGNIMEMAASLVSGEWYDVPVEPNSLVINIGDMLQEASQFFYPSTTHRVVKFKDQDAQQEASARYTDLSTSYGCHTHTA